MKFTIKSELLFAALRRGHKQPVVFTEPENWQQQLMDNIHYASVPYADIAQREVNYFTMFLGGFSIVASLALHQYLNTAQDTSSSMTVASFIGMDPNQLVNF